MPSRGSTANLEVVTVPQLDAHAREVVAANLYATLATVGPDGTPWASPVCFATDDYRHYYWVSKVDATHSTNLGGHSRVRLVIFDSTVRPYHGRAVYLSGEAGVLDGADLTHGIEVYPGQLAARQGATPVTLEDVTAPSPYRLYRAAATEAYVLCPREPRTPCAEHGLQEDHRAAVEPWRLPR